MLALTGVCSSAQTALPLPIRLALARADLDPQSLALWIAPVDAGAPRLAHQPDALLNPASVIKLVTSAAALDQLGPSYAWTTPVIFGGKVEAGVLKGDLVIEGRGDPKLVTERLWLLLRRVQALGVRSISGDIVLDRRAFQVPEVDPGSFDGERHRPYNVRPDALSVNYKSLLITLRPEPGRGVALVSVEPALAGLAAPLEVRLTDGPCNDWRAGLQADFSDPAQLRLAGRFPASCGEKTWPVAPAAPERFNARAIEAMWRDIGGQLGGRVRDGVRPQGVLATFEFTSPSLAEVLRDINKYSNNVMAQQLFLTLSLAQRGLGTWEGSRELTLARVQERAGCGAGELRLDNGSGLSRDERLTARCLGRVLQWAWASPWMPEYLASLPIAGEHTARRATAAAGRAHLKTGSLNNVAALAGYVDAASGRRYVLVAVINHPRAGSDEARALLDAVLRWTVEDGAEPAARP
ncbi:MAG: D-alanyl-D-alanine carboxypeptidase/D-alanyl-D-alanine-endopeptidase [Burkholderiales bacterium]